MPRGDAPPPTIAEMMRLLPGRLRAEHAAGWRSRFHFVASDAERGEWTVLVEGARCRVTEGLRGTADCTVTASEEVLVGIATGRRSAPAALLLGLIRISDLGEMRRFARVFPPLREG